MPAWRLTLLLCLAETLNMAGYAGVSSLLPELRAAWDLGNAEIILPIAEDARVSLRHRVRYLSELNRE